MFRVEGLGFRAAQFGKVVRERLELLWERVPLFVGNRQMDIHMSYSLNSLKGGFIGGSIGDYYRVIKGDSGSLGYSS